MRLAGRDARFELRIAGYQFPGDATSDYDSNWLVVEGSVRHLRGKWRFRDPCLLTYEVARLAGWLEAVAAGTEPEPWCGFIEPNLSFEVAGAGLGRMLRVSFALEARPRWAGADEDVSVEFPLSTLDLGPAVASLRAQLREYPQRAER
jgi:hypothetical protein